MEKRRRNEYIIIAILVLVLVALLWFLLRKAPEEGEVPVPNDPQTVREMPQARDVFTQEQLEQAEQGPEVAARTFAERFGSYSNQSNYGNVTDVLGIVTPELRAELEALRLAAEQEDELAYFGVNTRVVSSEIVTTEAGAQVVMQTQREEAEGSPGNVRIRYQELTVSLEKAGRDWLIASYEWGE